MIKRLFSSSVLSLVIKSLGLLFIYAISSFYGANSYLGIMILYWGYAIYLQGAIILPLTHYCVSSNLQRFVSIFSNSGYLILIIAFLLPKDYFPSCLLLSFMILNSKFDYALIKDEKVNLFHLLNSLKNLSALTGVIIGLDVKSVFTLYALGEGVKMLICLFIYRNNKKITTNNKLVFVNFSGFIKYSSFLLLVGSYLIVIKTAIANYDAKLIVELELLLRFSEIILVAFTSGVMPIYLSKLSMGNLKDRVKIERFSIFGTLIVSLLIIFIIGFFDIKPILHWFNISTSSFNIKVSLYFVVIVACLQVLLSFKRKEFGMNITFKELLLVSFIPLSLLFTFAFNFELLYVTIFSNMSIISFSLLVFIMCLAIESLFIHYKLKSKSNVSTTHR